MLWIYMTRRHRMLCSVLSMVSGRRVILFFFFLLVFSLLHDRYCQDPRLIPRRSIILVDILLQRLQRPHHPLDPRLLLLALVPRIRPAAVAALERVAPQFRDNELCPVDAALAEAPLHLGQLELRLLGLLGLALPEQLKDAHAVPGVQVRDARDAADAADRHGRDQPVALAGEGEELVGFELRRHARHLGDAAARQLDADDVGVLAQRGEHLRVDVEAGHDAGEVVDDDGDGAGVGELPEKGQDGGLGHGKVEVAGHEDQGVVCAGFGGQLRLGDDLLCGLAAAAERDGERLADGCGGLPGSLDQLALFLGRERCRFAVGAGNDDCTFVSSRRFN